MLLNNKNIHKNLFNKLIRLENSKLGTFRLLPKLHKNKFSCRPIINCNRHPTSTLRKLIDTILQPLLKQSFYYIKDSQDVLIKTKNLVLDENSKILSCDFESLYTKIDTSKLINVVCDSVKQILLSSNLLDIFAFHKILSLVLLNNIFRYNNHYFVQVSGIVMGTICGPTLANIFVLSLEKHWYNLNNPLLYLRFIDDILMIPKSPIN